jgi:malate dehydrogenase (oxaloacetate-decarboxylating)(NADP+)
MKTAPIEKFQYLVHLKATNVHLFYRLLSENIKVCEVSNPCNARS